MKIATIVLELIVKTIHIAGMIAPNDVHVYCCFKGADYISASIS